MKKMWYENLLNNILEINTSVLLVIDPYKILQNANFREMLKENFSQIYVFESEIKLRIFLRKNREERLIIIFNNENEIPYTFLSIYAQFKISIKDIFPLLDEKIFEKDYHDNFQAIYDIYLQKIEPLIYDKLTKETTLRFVSEAINSSKDETKLHINKKRNTLKKIIEKIYSNDNDIKLRSILIGEIGKQFGELSYLVDNNDLNDDLDDLRKQIKPLFLNFITRDYITLFYDHKSYINSNILDIIFENRNEKIVIICFDCMGFEEWSLIKEFLENRIENIYFSVKNSFSIIPSETKFSSSALFAGLTPVEIMNTGIVNKVHWQNEEKLFKYYLRKFCNIDENKVFFQRIKNPKELKIEFNALKDYSIIGLVFSFIDIFVHNSEMTKKLLLKTLWTYLLDKKLDLLLKTLIEQKFSIFITSDHGNIFAKGNGVIIRDKLADVKGKRYLIFPTKELAEEYQKKDQNSIIINLKDIINEHYILLLTDDNMFAGVNEYALIHGGISIEEVIIPFVEVKNDDRL